MQKLGERIRHVRGRMSQEAFAGLLGISKGALGGYERGENCPNADVILTIGKLQDGGELGRVPPVPGPPVARHGRRSPLPGSTGPVTHGRPASGAGRKMRAQGLRAGQALPSLSRMRLRVPGSGPGAGVPFAARRACPPCS